MPQVMNIPDAKAAVDKEWKKARDDPSVAIGECQEQEGDDPGCTRRLKESSLCHIDGQMSSQEGAESCSVVTQ